MDDRIRLIETRLADLDNEKLYLIGLKGRIENGVAVGIGDEDLIENTLFEGTYDLKLAKEYYVVENKEEVNFEFNSVGIHRINEVIETTRLKFTLEGNLRNGVFKIELKEDELTLIGNYKFDIRDIELSFNNNPKIRIIYQGANLENLNHLLNKYELSILSHLKSSK